MGSGTSAPETEQIFRRNGNRSAWLKFGDIMDARVSTQLVETQIAHSYHAAYAAQCALRRDAPSFAANEEFQLAVDSHEENPRARWAEIESVAHRHLHNVLDVVGAVMDAHDSQLSAADDAAHVAPDDEEGGGGGGMRGAAMDVAPVQVIPGIGRAFVRHSMFFFFWDSCVGDKFGRLELRNCRRLMDLQMTGVHVPLTFHVVYKGRAITAQALVPIGPGETTRVREAAMPEVSAFARQIIAAFNLLPFEEARGVLSFLPSGVHAHVGRDARVYFLRNYAWMPPWPSARGSRLSAEQRFSCVRQELLARQPSAQLCCRAFNTDALASENTSALRVFRHFLDVSLHDVPKVLGTSDERGAADSVIRRFRRVGFNYSMLGLLLLSLLRNVSPPMHAVRSVVTEMFVRGIRQFIMQRITQLGRSGGGGGGGAAGGVGGGGRRAGHHAAAGGGRHGGSAFGGDGFTGSVGVHANGGGGEFDDVGAVDNFADGLPDAIAGIGSDGEEDEADGVPLFGRSRNGGGDGSPLRSPKHRFAAAATAFDGGAGGGGGARAVGSRRRAAALAAAKAAAADSSLAFIDFTTSVLRAFLDYPGAPMPRPAALLQAAVPPPTDLFGGEVIPVIYNKFRLLTSDVDLYGPMSDEQKLAIYQRVCRSLGIAVANGAVTRVLPIVVGVGVTATGPLPRWVRLRTDTLLAQLMSRGATRSDWLRLGAGLVPLLRLQAPLLPHYADLLRILATLGVSQALLWQTMQASFSIEALSRVLLEREELIASATSSGAGGGGAALSVVGRNGASTRGPQSPLLATKGKSAAAAPAVMPTLLLQAARNIVIHLRRKIAFAAFDMGCLADAAAAMYGAVTPHADALLEALGNPFSTQYRRFTSELAFYSARGDLAIEARMIRLLSRYCEPDVTIAEDYLQLGVVRHRMRQRQRREDDDGEGGDSAGNDSGSDGETGQRRRQQQQGGGSGSEPLAEEGDLTRAARLFEQLLGERHPKTIRAVANLAAVWFTTAGRREEATALLQELVEVGGRACPPDVVLSLRAAEGGGDDEAGGAAAAVVIPEERDPLMYAMHVPRF